MSVDPVALLPEAVERVAKLASGASWTFHPRDHEDVVTSSLSFEDVAEWVSQGDEHLAAFLMAVQAFVHSVEKVAGDKVEGVAPGEFLDGVLVVLRAWPKGGSR